MKDKKVINIFEKEQQEVQRLSVVLCENNKALCDQLEQLLKQYSIKHKIVISIRVVRSGEELHILLQKFVCDLLFLNVNMRGINGLECGYFIRECMKNYTLEIIYISSKANYVLGLFYNRPFDFLSEPISKELLNWEMDKFLKVFMRKESSFLYKKKGCIVRQELRDILYFESHLKKISINTFNGSDEFYGSLKEVHQRLENEYFFFCHNSILINYKNINKIYFDKLCLNDGTILPISQSRRPLVRKLIDQWKNI